MTDHFTDDRRARVLKLQTSQADRDFLLALASQGCVFLVMLVVLCWIGQ